MSKRVAFAAHRAELNAKNKAVRDQPRELSRSLESDVCVWHTATVRCGALGRGWHEAAVRKCPLLAALWGLSEHRPASLVLWVHAL